MEDTYYRASTAKARYEKLVSERRPYTDRAEKCAKYTIPMAFPKETDNSNTNYETPYQSLGARGVNNLSSKLLLALFPPNAPFFRLSLGDDIANVVEQNPSLKQEYEAFLAKLERRITNYMETHRIRVTSSEALTQLIIAGNVLLFLPPAEGGMKMYRLNSYVVQRDGVGNVCEIIAKESIAFSSLPPEAQSCVDQQDVDPDKNFAVYTHVYLEDEQFKSYQELEGVTINGSEQAYPIDKSPWIAVRIKKMDGESYGRSFVDEYLGDIRSLENLSKAIVEVACVAANIIYLVNPSSTLRVSQLAEAKSGDFVKGKRDDIQALQLDKSVDLQVVFSCAQQIEGRLSYAFLLNSAVQRNAERVTAEEIRYVANELEDTIGGIYSILSQEFQLPLVRRMLTQMAMIGAIPELPQGAQGIEPKITTGLEALGRGHDLTKIDAFLKYAAQFPDLFASRVKVGEVLKQLATALGIDAADVIKSDEEVAQEQQAAQEQQLAQQAASPLIQGAMK